MTTTMMMMMTLYPEREACLFWIYLYDSLVFLHTYLSVMYIHTAVLLSSWCTLYIMPELIVNDDDDDFFYTLCR